MLRLRNKDSMVSYDRVNDISPTEKIDIPSLKLKIWQKRCRKKCDKVKMFCPTDVKITDLAH